MKPLTKFLHEIIDVTDEILKAHRVTIDSSVLHPKAHAARGAVQFAVHHMFIRQRKTAAEFLRKHYKPGKKSRKAKLIKRTPEEIWQDLYNALLSEFLELPDEIQQSLEDAAIDGVNAGIAQLQIDDADVISAVNGTARDWARERAAEMVGMRWDDDGSLIQNPNAEWAITDTTRTELRRIITESFEAETPLDELIADIQEAGVFSESRATMIARTEVATAQSAGNYEVWSSADVPYVRWLLSEDHDDTGCACEDNDDVVVPIGTPFPSGDLYPVVHPHCMCSVVAVFDEPSE